MRAVSGRHRRQNVRREQFAAVEHRTHRRRKPYRRSRDRLPKAYPRQIDRLDRLLGQQYPRALAGQIDARARTYPELFEIVVRRLRSRAQRDVHEHAVARVHDAVSKVLTAVPYAPPTAYPRAVDDAIAGAIVRIADQPLLDPHRRGQYLERRARLVDVGDQSVFRPLQQQREIVSRQVVEIVCRRARHRQDLARDRVHHQTARRQRRILFDRVTHRLFGKALQSEIDRQCQRRPVDRRQI